MNNFSRKVSAVSAAAGMLFLSNIFESRAQGTQFADTLRGECKIQNAARCYRARIVWDIAKNGEGNMIAQGMSRELYPAMSGDEIKRGLREVRNLPGARP